MKALIAFLSAVLIILVSLYGWFGSLHPCEALANELMRGSDFFAVAEAGEVDFQTRAARCTLICAVVEPIIAGPISEKSPAECTRDLWQRYTNQD